MGLFGKKASVKAGEDRELIKQNAAAVDALIVLAEGNTSMTEQLTDMREKIKYLVPVEDGKVSDFDKKIKNLLGDMRIALVKGDGEDTKKTERIMQQIKLAVADRNAKL